VAARFGHSLTMITELISASDDQALPPAVRMTCVEAWFLHYRLLIEFLVIGTSKNCAEAQDLATGWDPETTKDIQRLRQDYGWASEHIVHIGGLKPNTFAQNVDASTLRLKAASLLDVVDDFVTSLEAQGSPYSEIVRVATANSRSAL
jgi:hypothetical protein